MKRWRLGLMFALSYFTLLPVPVGKNDDFSDPRILGAAALTLPLVGAVLALLTWLLYMPLAPLGWLGAVAAALAYPMLYGFIHTEALSDVADAIYARHSGKDAYDVIKDPHTGAMGVLWMVSLLALKTAALAYVLSHHLFDLFLITVLASRTGLAVLFATQTFRSSFVRHIRQGLKPFDVAILTAGLGIIVAALWGGYGALTYASGMAVAYLVAKRIGGMLGFLNGDVLGATLEITEALMLLMGARLWL